MARSTNKRPFCGWTYCRSEKKDKQDYHRRYRSAVRQALRLGLEPPHFREYSNRWMWGKDGRQYFGDWLGDQRSLPHPSPKRPTETYDEFARRLMRK
jgi:hypothetical protein